MRSYDGGPLFGPRPCQQCQQLFVPRTSFAKVCGANRCVKAFLKALDRARIDDRKATKAKVAALRSVRSWASEAQVVVNAWVRARDTAKGYGCISCGIRTARWNAGHFLHTQSNPELRFHEDNIHLQCVKCNMQLSGNPLKYRSALIERIGAERVEWLEGPHGPMKYTIDQLKAIISDYRKRLRDMKRHDGLQVLPGGSIRSAD